MHAEEGADHGQHLDVAEPHAFDAAEELPDARHDEQDAGADERALQRAGERTPGEQGLRGERQGEAGQGDPVGQQEVFDVDRRERHQRGAEEGGAGGAGA